jgi:hypothetical protein
MAAEDSNSVVMVDSSEGSNIEVEDCLSSFSTVCERETESDHGLLKEDSRNCVIDELSELAGSEEVSVDSVFNEGAEKLCCISELVITCSVSDSVLVKMSECVIMVCVVSKLAVCCIVSTFVVCHVSRKSVIENEPSSVSAKDSWICGLLIAIETDIVFSLSTDFETGDLDCHCGAWAVSRTGAADPALHWTDWGSVGEEDPDPDPDSDPESAWADGVYLSTVLTADAISSPASVDIPSQASVDPEGFTDC